MGGFKGFDFRGLGLTCLGFMADSCRIVGSKLINPKP